MARRELLLPLLCGLLIAAAYAHPAATAGARKMVGVYELRKGDFSVKVTNFGARLMSVVFPDSKGSCSVLGSRFLSPNCVFCWDVRCWDPSSPFMPNLINSWLVLLQGIWPMSSLAWTPSLNTL
jgi:hypothetical protein